MPKVKLFHESLQIESITPKLYIKYQSKKCSSGLNKQKKSCATCWNGITIAQRSSTEDKGNGKHGSRSLAVNIFLLDIKLLNEVSKIIVVTLGRWGKWVALIKSSAAVEGRGQGECNINNNIRLTEYTKSKRADAAELQDSPFHNFFEEPFFMPLFYSASFD